MTKILVIQYFIININVRYSNHYQRNILHLQLIKFSFHIRINILDPYHIRPVTEKKYMYYANSNAGNGGQKKHGLSMQAEAIFLFSYMCILTYIHKNTNSFQSASLFYDPNPETSLVPTNLNGLRLNDGCIYDICCFCFVFLLFLLCCCCVYLCLFGCSFLFFKFLSFIFFSLSVVSQGYSQSS